MSDYLANACITAAILCFTFLGYRLYFNVPDIEDTPGDDFPPGAPIAEAETAGLGGGAPSDVVMEEIYSEAADCPGEDALDGLIPQLNAAS